MYKQLQKKSFPPPHRRESPREPVETNTPFVRAGQTFAETVKNRKNQAQATQNANNNSTYNSQAAPSTSASSTKNDDMTELKSMLKALMEQMSSMLNLLTAFVANTSK